MRVYTASGSAESPPLPLTLSVGRFQLIEVDVPKPEAVLWLVQPESARSTTAACRELPPGTKIHGTLEGQDLSQLHTPASAVHGWLLEQANARGVIAQYDLDGTLYPYLPKLRAAIAQYTKFPDTGAAWTPELRAAMVARFRALGAALKEVTK